MKVLRAKGGQNVLSNILIICKKNGRFCTYTAKTA